MATAKYATIKMGKMGEGTVQKGSNNMASEKV